MTRSLRIAAVVGAILGMMCWGQTAFAQKAGGTLKISFFDNPASMSLHEEATGAALRPMMGVFNNLVIYRQDVAQNSPQSIVPDLATSWAWSGDGKELTFPLRQGVKWHDGKPFTAADVKCTWDLLMGTASEKLRVNPRKTWYLNLDRVTTNGDYEVTFHLKRPQPALLSLLASGWSPVYPCHVPAREMRTHPIGTGPFKFVEFKPNEVVRTARNPDYWKPGRPYLDGIEWHIIPDLSTRNLSFIAGRFDISSPYGTTVPLLDDVRRQAPQAICVLTATNVSRNLILNREKPPFDNLDLRRAVALASTARPSSTSSSKARGISARLCCRRLKDCGGCRRRCWRRCRATIPISGRTAPKRARSWRSSVTGPTSGSPLPCPRATSPPTGSRR
jgi:peptide/nickel transport system substrate-binding protein